MSTEKAALAWCPFPDVETARAVSRVMLEERLIACANIIPAVESLFLWEGSIDQGAEVGVLFKTTSEGLDQLIARLGDCHPYDTPAVVGWHCDAAHPETLDWLTSAVGKV